MDLKDIRQIIKIVESSNISEFELDEGGTKVRILKNSGAQAPPVSNAQIITAPAPQPVVHTPVNTAVVQSVPAAEAEKTVSDNMIEVRSPMVGTFYRRHLRTPVPMLKLVKPYRSVKHCVL